MNTVRIVGTGVAHPELRVTREESAEHIGSAAGVPRRAAAIARASGIETRASILPPGEVVRLGSIEARNALYREHAPALAAAAASNAIGEQPSAAIRCLVTSTCTGYALPGWGVGLVSSLGLCLDTARVPLTEAGCAGGAVAIARATDFLRTRDNASALTVATELCSLAFHPDADDGNLTSSLIFGDGAGAALLQSGDGPGIEIVDSASMLVPDSQHALGFDLTDAGFYPVLDRELPNLLVEPTRAAVFSLLRRNGLAMGDIHAWLLHPGGARILDRLEAAFCIRREQSHWSWDSLHDTGNTSSAAIFDVLHRYYEDPASPRGWGLVIAFGPGVSIELLLTRWQ